MKVAVCTLYLNDWYYRIVKYGVESLKLYCKKHGYDFYAPNEVYDKERSCAWYKIKAIELVLNKGYDYVLWIDADGHILKPNLDITYFIKLSQGKDLMCGKDWNNPLNTGVMMVKNTQFIHDLFKAVWNNENDFDKSFEEQASLGQIYTSNFMKAQDNIEILKLENRHILYCYWSEYSPYRIPFFIHIARCSSDREGFMYTIDCYCPIKMDEDVEGEWQERVRWMRSEKSLDDIDRWRKGGLRNRNSTRSKQYLVEIGKIKNF